MSLCKTYPLQSETPELRKWLQNVFPFTLQLTAAPLKNALCLPGIFSYIFEQATVYLHLKKPSVDLTVF